MIVRASMHTNDEERDGFSSEEDQCRTFKRIRRSSQVEPAGRERGRRRREKFLVYMSGSSEEGEEEEDEEEEEEEEDGLIETEAGRDQVGDEPCEIQSDGQQAIMGCCMRVMVSEEEMEETCRRLTCVPRSMRGFLHEPVEMFVRLGSRKLLVPRFFGTSTFGSKAWSNLEVEEDDAASRWSFSGQLNSLQDEAVAACMRAYHKDRGGILSLYCGAGKTVCALWLVSHIRRKTLIIVHKSFLCDQWAERALRFVPQLRVGVIRQDRVETEGKDIVIAMLQSLVTRDSYPLSDFDHIIFDECHHICARAFSRALFKIGCSHRTGDVCVLGLSATPHRRDGLTRVLHWFLGETAYEASYSPARAEDVSVVCIGVESSSSKCAGGLAEMVTALTEMQERNRVVAREVLQAWREGRRILLLSDRRAHLETLEQLLAHQDRRTERDVGFYVGGRTSAELKAASCCRIILATYSMCSEGLDIPSLNTLILATPRADIAQSVGRILRSQEEGARAVPPKIVDVLDIGVHQRFAKMAEGRKKFYRSSGFAVLQYCCESDDEVDGGEEEEDRGQEAEEKEEKDEERLFPMRSLRYRASETRAKVDISNLARSQVNQDKEVAIRKNLAEREKLRDEESNNESKSRKPWMKKLTQDSGRQVQVKTCPQCRAQFSAFFQHTCT
mmetsp:Transcript_37281/g.117408  ORF Transcript_37281/g.117408 Transcript_37281/m.117408 type:complete len:671 (-) Transcript_37281:1734-3746(-)